MRRKTYGFILSLAVLLMFISSFPVLARAPEVNPSLSFSGTSAVCSVSVLGKYATDSITATIKLKRENTVVKTWKVSGVAFLKFDDVVSVSKGYTYTLSVVATVNDKNYSATVSKKLS